jgi:hypothetical protein
MKFKFFILLVSLYYIVPDYHRDINRNIIVTKNCKSYDSFKFYYLS